jgi:hypothetical protein
LIDEDFRTWLLEVNNNPFLGYQNDAQYVLAQSMLTNLMDITISPLLNENQKKKRNEPTPGSPKFEMIYSDY